MRDLARKAKSTPAHTKIEKIFDFSKKAARSETILDAAESLREVEKELPAAELLAQHSLLTDVSLTVFRARLRVEAAKGVLIDEANNRLEKSISKAVRAADRAISMDVSLNRAHGGERTVKAFFNSWEKDAAERETRKRVRKAQQAAETIILLEHGLSGKEARAKAGAMVTEAAKRATETG